MNLEILVEERSAEQALRILLPRIVPNSDFEVRVFQGKTDLLKKLPDRLNGYATWITQAGTCLVVLVDRDDDDCLTLKADMELMAAAAGLPTATTAPVGRRAEAINRITVEELEAWFFGEVPALCATYPRVPLSLGQQANTATLMRLQVARGRRWSSYFRSVDTTEVVLPRSRRPPRSRRI